MSCDRQSQIVSPDSAEPSNISPILTDLKIEQSGSSHSAAQRLDPREHRRPRESSDDPSESHGGAVACYHARGVELELSIQVASCDCEGTMTRARKRRLSDSPLCDWQLVRCHLNPDPEFGRLESPSCDGIVLPANYLRFAQNFGQDFGIVSADGSGRSVVAVGLLLTGRIMIVHAACLQKVVTALEFDVVAFAEMISRACCACRKCSDDDSAEETVARNFVSEIQVRRVDGALSCPTFESIFDRICAVSFNHQVEDHQRAPFLRALHCICSFKNFQTRFVSRRGQLALISLLQSCQSCTCADLALNCVHAVSGNKAAAAKLICPALIEALLSLVEQHNAVASKACAILEQW